MADLRSTVFRRKRDFEYCAMVSLSGFSLVGGPAYNNTDAAVETLKNLDIPYIAAHLTEFQPFTWSNSRGGLGPIETTMLIALPELDSYSQSNGFCGAAWR